MTTSNPLFLLKNVRIVFPKLLKGQEEAFEGKGDPYYSASFIVSPDDPQIAGLKTAIRDAAVAKHKEKADDVLKVYQMKDKLPIHDGALKSGKPYGEAYKGKLYVSARNNAKTNPPVAVFDNVQDAATGHARAITESTDARFPYSGSYVNVFLNFFAYSAGGGEGVGASIAGVQFHADGERLAGGVTAKASDFAAVPAEKKEAAASTGKGAAALFG
jgi:hypothetical protein